MGRTIKDLKKDTHPYQKCSEASWGNTFTRKYTQNQIPKHTSQIA